MAGVKRYRELEEALASSARLREMLEEISRLKDAGSPPPDAKRTKRDTALALIRHKATNRNAHLAAEERKADLEGLQEAHFKANLRLQNLLCQQEHLEREIGACRAFRSSHEEMGLAPAAGEEVGHAEMLQRLTFELNERKRLREQINGLKQRRLDIQKAINEKTAFLSGLQQQVASVNAACRPLQKHIPAKFQQPAAYDAAQRLPVPLYTVYYQLAVYREAFDEENVAAVDIEGTKEAAEAWKRRQAAHEQADGSPDAMDTSADDEPGAIQADGSLAASATDRHPLAVVVKLSPDGCDPLTVRFYYLHRLNVVSVSADGKEGFLTNLYPCDTGAQSPNPATGHLLASGRAVPSSAGVGRPYHWAQRMAGLQFLAASQEENLDFRRPELDMGPRSAAADVLARLQGRLRARAALRAATTSLKQGNLPKMTTAKPKAGFAGFAKMSRSEYQALVGQEKLEEWQHVDAAYYKLRITVGSPAKSYDTAILVPADYPVCPALLHLAAADSGSVGTSKLPEYVNKLADKKALAAMQAVTAQASSFKSAEAAVNVNVQRFVPAGSEHLTFVLQLCELCNQLLELSQ